MKSLTIFVAAALFIMLPQVASAQRFVFTNGIHNGNICRAQGTNCHVPQAINTVPAMAQPIVINHPSPVASVSLDEQPGLISRAFSGFMSLF